MKKTTLALALSAVFYVNYATAQDAQPNVVNITINNVGDDSGLEMGTGSRARGQGSIATGKNSVALGKNAVATGGNENKDTITRKLNENKQKLADIATAEANTNRLLDELQNIRKVEADVIEAGERVKQVRLAKQSAYTVWQEKLKTYHDTVANSTQELQQAQAKIDDLNSRLTGVSRIGGVDISSEEGLTHAATQLKSIAEEDTTLNLSVDFYKDYVKSYYQALGDLRLKEIAYSKIDSTSLIKHSNITYPCNCLNVLSYVNEQTKDKIKHQVLNYVDIDTTIISQQQWNEAQQAATTLKEIAVPFYAGEATDTFVTDEVRIAAVNQLLSRVDIYLKSNEIAYYQGQYEATKNTSWLDKKVKALNEYARLGEQYNSLPDPFDLKKQLMDQWYAENIKALKERNIITTTTLTSELEKALGINKHTTEEKQAQLARLKTEVEQAKSAYDNTNPSQADIALSQRYEQIMGQLTAKANELKSEQERLQALRHALTLHDLTNVGENAYAIGTNALATGKNSLAIGTDTIVTGENSIAIGKGSVVTGINSIAIGTGHNVLGNNSGAFGDPDYIYGDGSYAFGNNNTIGEATNPHNSGNNTFVLGSNVVTKANNAVILGANSADGGDNTVSVGSATAQRKIVYVADGTISQTSKDAINGSQIHDILENGTAVNVENWKTLLGVGSTENSATATALSNLAADLAKHLGGGATVDADGRVTSPTYSITDVTGEKPAAKNYNNVGDALTALDNNTKALNTSLSNKADKTDITNINTSLDGINTALNGKANTSLNNITSDGETVIKNLAKGAVKVVAGTNTTVTEGTDGDAKTYAVNISNEAIKGAVQKDLDSKANKDASNLETADVQKWQEKLGNGTNTKGDKGLITGDTLYTAINGINAVASVNNLAGDVAQHLGGGATAVDGRIAAPTYSIKDVATNATGVYNSVGGAIQALDSNTQALSARVDSMGGEIQGLRKEIGDVRKEAFAGTATALAVAGLGQSTSPGKTSVSMSTSAYRGQTGYALGISRLSESGKFLLKGAVSGNNRGHYGGVVSATYTFD